MSNLKFAYPAEKLHVARGSLMAPHFRGEPASFADAFQNCHLGLMDVTDADLDDNARRWIATIRSAMNTDGIEDPDGRGAYEIRAERLTLDERYEFSHAVDELASWFDDQAWGSDE